jgi:hypothetical protein
MTASVADRIRSATNDGGYDAAAKLYLFFFVAGLLGAILGARLVEPYDPAVVVLLAIVYSSIGRRLLERHICELMAPYLAGACRRCNG